METDLTMSLAVTRTNPSKWIPAIGTEKRGKAGFKEDKDGDGFDDELPVQLNNEAKPEPKKGQN
jgi:hypothetical protein